MRTILIADDEVCLTTIVAYNIKKSGANVLVAHNGAEACELARVNKPDLIICDYQMPVMDGLQACIKFKEMPETAAIPVFMLTARGHRIAPEDLAKTNIHTLLPKPFSAKDLISRIDELFKSKVAA